MDIYLIETSRKHLSCTMYCSSYCFDMYDQTLMLKKGMNCLTAYKNIQLSFVYFRFLFIDTVKQAYQLSFYCTLNFNF